jgi:hypothetical protein
MSQENKKTELVLSSVQVENLDNIVSAIESVIDMDNIYTKDRANLVNHVVKKVAELLDLEPSFELWNKVHEYLKSAICKARAMTDESFDNNIWNLITKRLELDFALVKPNSTNPESVKKQAQIKAKQAELDKLTDKELEEKGYHKELGIRKENRAKNAEKAIQKAHDDFVKKFKTDMEALAKNEYDFAMYISTNIDTIKKQFKAKK